MRFLLILSSLILTACGTKSDFPMLDSSNPNITSPQFKAPEKRDTNAQSTQNASAIAKTETVVSTTESPTEITDHVTKVDSPSSKNGDEPNTSQDTSVPNTPSPDYVTKVDDVADMDRPFITSLIFLDDQRNMVPAEEYLPIISSAAGTRLDLNKLAEDAQKIKDAHPELAAISTQILPNTQPGQVSIIFEFLRKRIIDSVEIKMDPKEAKLPKDVRDRIKSKLGTILRPQDLVRDEEVIRVAMINAGYPKASIAHEINEKDKEKATISLVFHIKTGSPQATIASFLFTGNQAFDSKVLKGKLSNLAKAKKFIFWSSSTDIFNEFDFFKDIKALKEFYESEGYADVEVNGSYDISSSGKTTVKFDIKEGAHYAINTIEISGNKLFAETEILKKVKLKPGSNYSGKMLRQSAQTLREMYGEQGFIFMDVKLEYDPAKGSLNIHINEGERQTVEKIEVKGNQTHDENTIKNSIPVKEGEPVNSKKVNEGVNNLNKSGDFKTVAVGFQPSPVKPNQGIITVEVEEVSTSSISFNFGYGNQTGFQGELHYSDDNIGGKGFGFSIDAIISEEDNRIAAVFNQKYIFGSDFDLSASAGYNKHTFDPYTKETAAIRATVEREIINDLTIGIGARIEFVNISDADPGLPQEVYDSEGKIQVIGGLVSKAVYQKERYDENREAYGGYKIKLAFLPSYSDQGVYVKSVATILGHQTLGQNADGQKHILTGRITVGYASDNIPFHEKFYAGGNSTLRGYDFGSVTEPGSALGGTKMVSGGMYYSFPLWGQKLRGVAFVEAASVGDNFSDLGNVRVVGGLGVRADLRDSFLRNKIEAGFVFPAIQQPGDKPKPFYLLFGDYHPIYDL